jgi:hypothetical protein
VSAVTCRKVQSSHSDQLKLVLLPPFSFPQARRFLRTLLRPQLDLAPAHPRLFFTATALASRERRHGRLACLNLRTNMAYKTGTDESSI